MATECLAAFGEVALFPVREWMASHGSSGCWGAAPHQRVPVWLQVALGCAGLCLLVARWLPGAGVGPRVLSGTAVSLPCASGPGGGDGDSGPPCPAGWAAVRESLRESAGLPAGEGAEGRDGVLSVLGGGLGNVAAGQRASETHLLVSPPHRSGFLLFRRCAKLTSLIQKSAFYFNKRKWL